jgi:2-methylisocitrate lyase-like PEP mutase family enzyme
VLANDHALLHTNQGSRMTDNRTAQFRALHERPGIALLLPNIWDAASAALFGEAGCLALATSSASMAWSLGYADGGALPRDELLGAVRRILRVTRLPLTVDLEDGYSHQPVEVAQLVAELAALGVAGINIEDGSGAPELLCAKIEAIRTTPAGAAIFVNARTDVYLRQMATGAQAVAMVLARLASYRRAGADGAFVPGLGNLPEIERVASGTPMPLNVMLLPGMHSVRALAEAHVRRLSVGPATFQAGYGVAQNHVRQFLREDDPTPMLQTTLDYQAMNVALSPP